ncbi:putative holin-like toxin [Paenibacillus sp. FSL H7-0357]
MEVYQALTLMISFATLIVLILHSTKRNRPPRRRITVYLWRIP